MAILDEEQNDQHEFRDFIDHRDRTRAKSIEAKIQHERRGGKNDQQPAHKALIPRQRWQVERADEHEVAYPVDQVMVTTSYSMYSTMICNKCVEIVQII